ncbi:MAG: FapA family protein [Lachnospiraceae bacterium]|nr:FapA family protein [Lachnospiraceae bacterium]
MANKNAYFQLKLQMDGTYLLLYPGTEKNLLDFKEIDDYLREKRIDYDKDELKQAIVAFRTACSIKLSGKMCSKEKESLSVQVSEDRMTVTGRFYPPVEGGHQLSKAEIVSELVRAGVKFGAKEGVIDSYLADRQYCCSYLLAEGMPQVEGKNAVFTYHFNTDLSRKPKLNEDGSVDFHQLDTICPVEEGDALVTLTPAVPGKPGLDVTGRVLAPATVKKVAMRPEKNTYLSEDGLTMFSAVDGLVSLIDGKVFVSNIYDVPADVDTSTGDIKFPGSVFVHGNVITGFSVEAEGDIVVDGVVEGARLKAGGQIVLKRGIQGMGRGILEAKGNIITKFIENATVRSGGYVATEAIMHSKVAADGDVTASGRRGFVVGGEIRSGTSISVRTAGSTMGTATVLEIGADAEHMEEYRKVSERLPELEAELEKVTQTCSTLTRRMLAGVSLGADKMALLKTARESKESLEKEIQVLLARMDDLQEIAGAQSGGNIRVSGVIYPGCKVIMYNTTYYVRSEMKYCRLIKDRADVKMVEY